MTAPADDLAELDATEQPPELHVEWRVLMKRRGWSTSIVRFVDSEADGLAMVRRVVANGHAPLMWRVEKRYCSDWQPRR